EITSHLQYRVAKVQPARKLGSSPLAERRYEEIQGRLPECKKQPDLLEVPLHAKPESLDGTSKFLRLALFPHPCARCSPKKAFAFVLNKNSHDRSRQSGPKLCVFFAQSSSPA